MKPGVRMAMSRRVIRHAFVIAALALAVVALAACSVTRHVVPPTERLTLIAVGDVNPDGQGRPSPVAVRVFQLSSRTTLDNLDFDGAFDNAEVLLGDELLFKEDLMLQPGETRELRFPLERDTGHVAIAAGFRQIDGARWKLVYEVNANWSGRHSVMLTETSVVAGEPEPEPVARDDEPQPELMH